MIELKNNAGSSLAVGVSAAETVAQVLSVDAAEFPLLGYGDVFTARLRDAAGNHEYVLATARDGNLITMVRGQEGTPARAFPAGASFELMVTAKAWELLAENRWARPRNAAGELLTPTRVSAVSFTIPGDQTSFFVPNRALHLIQTASAYGYVSSAAYAGGATTVVVQGCVVDAGLAMVELGLEVNAAPKYGNASNADTLEGSSKAQIVADAQAGTAANAAALEGRTKSQVIDDMRAAVGAYTRQQYAVPVVLAAQSGLVALDADLHQDIDITATGAVTFGAPANAVRGKTIFMTLYAASALAITWNAAFKPNADNALDTAFVAGKRLFLQFRCTDGAYWLLMGRTKEA